MSLNIEKKERLNPQTPLSPQQTDAGTVSSPKNPIDFTSEETKSKPKTMGIAVEKTQKEEPQTDTTSIKENEKAQETSTEKAETTLTSKSSDEQVSTAETLTASNKPKEQSELDKKLEEYSQKNNLANIDDVRASLISKQKEGTLTKSEEQLLTELDKPKKLISDEVLNSAEWKSKSPKEKINEYVKAYLEKFDDKFASKSKKEQEKQIKAQIKEFNEYIKISNAVYSSAEIKNIATLAETLNSKNLEFKEFKTQGYKAFQNELVPLERRQSEEWRNATPEQRLTEYVEGYCAKTIKGFSEIKDPKQKAEIVSKTIQGFAEKFIGKEAYAKLSEEQKDALYSKAATYFDAIDSSKYTIEQYFDLSPEKQVEVMKKYYEEKQGIYKYSLNGKSAEENYMEQRKELKEKIDKYMEDNKKALKKQIEAIAEEVKKEVCQAIQE